MQALYHCWIISIFFMRQWYGKAGWKFLVCCHFPLMRAVNINRNYIYLLLMTLSSFGCCVNGVTEPSFWSFSHVSTIAVSVITFLFLLKFPVIQDWNNFIISACGNTIWQCCCEDISPCPVALDTFFSHHTLKWARSKLHGSNEWGEGEKMGI